jgi:antitoxin (DNA-binding transcriptional repressor) of toxin-antitoxin stability system
MVTRYGTPVAQIVPVTPGETGGTRYPLRGQTVTLTADFDAPMPEMWQALAVAESPGACAAVKRPHSKKVAKP